MSDLKQQLRQYVEANIERVDADDIRVAASRPIDPAPPSRPRFKPVWAFVLGAVFVLALGGVAILLRGDSSLVNDATSGPDEATVDKAASRAAFTFAEDDLCEWVTEDEMTAFLREAYSAVGVDWTGTAAAAAPEGTAWNGRPSAYCRWEPTGGGGIIATGLTPSHFPGPIVEYSEISDEAWLPIDVIAGHPDLADGVIVANAAFGRFGFWPEGSEEVLGLEMQLLAGVARNDRDSQQQMLLHMANSLLDELGWTPSPGA